MCFKKITAAILSFVISSTLSLAQDRVASFADADNSSSHVTAKPMFCAAAAVIESTNNAIADALIETASKYVGTPYRLGSTGPNRFDCSGFTSFVYRTEDIQLMRRSADQYTQGKRVSLSELKKGDLVFFSGSRGGSRVGHVGMVVEADNDSRSFRFIHASCHGVREDSSTDSYYSSRYIGACRILEN